MSAKPKSRSKATSASRKAGGAKKKTSEVKNYNTAPLMDPERYEEFDGEWRKIGLAAPARRALVDAKLFRVSDLRKISLSDLEDLHGMGKSAIARLKVVMEAKKIKFRN